MEIDPSFPLYITDHGVVQCGVIGCEDAGGEVWTPAEIGRRTTAAALFDALAAHFAEHFLGPCDLCEHVGPRHAPEGTVDTLVCDDWQTCRERYLAKNPHVAAALTFGV